LMIREHIPRNHPMFERLEVCAKPVEDHWKNRLKLGQDWGLVRSDLSVDTLFERDRRRGRCLLRGPSFHDRWDSESNAEAGALHGMLGPVFRFLLQEPGAPL
jgi:hypothetical protein